MFLVSSILAILGAEAALPASPPAMSFRVERGGSPIGTHTIAFREDGDTLHVDIDINLAVSFGPITVFRYEHRNREVWRDGRLVSLETVTNDDGRDYRVSAKATEQGLEVTSSANGTFMAPSDIIPTSYWNPATVSQSQLLDTQKGRVIEVEVSPLRTDEVAVDGSAVTATEYAMTGDLKLRLWYSAKQEWLKVAFMARGEEVDYAVERFDRKTIQKIAAR